MNTKLFIALACSLAFGSVSVAQAADPPAAPAPAKDATKPAPAPQKDEKKTDKPAEKTDATKPAPAPTGGK